VAYYSYIHACIHTQATVFMSRFVCLNMHLDMHYRCQYTLVQRVTVLYTHFTDEYVCKYKVARLHTCMRARMYAVFSCTFETYTQIHAYRGPCMYVNMHKMYILCMFCAMLYHLYAYYRICTHTCIKIYTICMHTYIRTYTQAGWQRNLRDEITVCGLIHGG
jgi:hypothetical protein